jgi:hypothetical protein
MLQAGKQVVSKCLEQKLVLVQHSVQHVTTKLCEVVVVLQTLQQQFHSESCCSISAS